MSVYNLPLLLWKTALCHLTLDRAIEWFYKIILQILKIFLKILKIFRKYFSNISWNFPKYFSIFFRNFSLNFPTYFQDMTLFSKFSEK